ncbi:hypothetical protein COB21_05235 [Candidatus Aerophobetes bacterium]|uniref:Uncharacterized protein n=1 Tax=Aerophobetes bacterium TaxID=2030807 RepID=A0A2A4X0C2_UNCAE|nr:MAG: hypothetical protein COB21_05235 [Candidatus Aerophobetes bacterium]
MKKFILATFFLTCSMVTSETYSCPSCRESLHLEHISLFEIVKQDLYIQLLTQWLKQNSLQESREGSVAQNFNLYCSLDQTAEMWGSICCPNMDEGKIMSDYKPLSLHLFLESLLKNLKGSLVQDPTLFIERRKLAETAYEDYYRT